MSMVLFDSFFFYNPYLNFFIAVLYWLSFFTVGSFLRSKFHSFVFGILVVSLVVQILSFLHITNFAIIMNSLGYGLLLLGLYGFYLLRDSTKLIYSEMVENGFLLVLLVVLGLGFLISLAPLSKHDEVFYHALLPARILSDNYLHFYMWPFEAAMLPQMFFQIAMVPLFAIGHPNASNSVGFLFSVLIALYLYKLFKEKTDKKYAAILTTLSILGLHTFVFHVTMGGHAFGELSLLLLLGTIFIEKISSIKKRIFIVSMLSVAVVGAKLSYIPLTVAVVLMCIYKEFVRDKNFSFANLSLFLLPILIFYMPILIYTFINSGSPFGPAFAGVFGHSVYNVDMISATMNSYSSKLPYLNLAFVYFAKTIAFDYTPIVTIGLLVFFFRGYKIEKAVWILSILQFFVIYLKLPHDIRFFGGLLYFVAFLFWSNFYKKEIFIKHSKFFYKFFYLILAGYLFLDIFYGIRFFPVSLGLENKESFFTKNIAMYEDYLKLDEILPKNSVLLACGGRLNGVYMPRDVIYSIDDFWREDKEIFLLHIGENVNECKIGDFILGEKVYKNENAKITTYRAPFKKPDIGTLSIYKLTRKTK